MLGILGKSHAGPPKADVVTCSTCFIRCTSGSVLPTALPAVFAICTQITAIQLAQSPSAGPSALSRSSMRREHCGNFSVAHLVTSAEVLQRAGGHPRPTPPRGRRVARCFHTRGGTVVSAGLEPRPRSHWRSAPILARVKLTLVSDLTGVDRARRLLPDPKARQLPMAPALLALVQPFNHWRDGGNSIVLASVFRRPGFGLSFPQHDLCGVC